MPSSRKSLLLREQAFLQPEAASGIFMLRSQQLASHLRWNCSNSLSLAPRNLGTMQQPLLYNGIRRHASTSLHHRNMALNSSHNSCIFKEKYIGGNAYHGRNETFSEKSITSQLQRHFSSSSILHDASSQDKVDLDSITDRALLLKRVADFPPERIRNFSIIAHIDHGKSTLSDRLLKLTETVKPKSERPQFLDKLQVERERGITVKAQTCVMFYKYEGKWYLINLIDTPGHVDFSYEVSRSLSACDGALLLVDSGQGVEAQTLANYYLAVEQELEIVPVMTKVDQQTATPDHVAMEMEETLGVEKDDILRVSAKSGLNCEKVLDIIVKQFPPPRDVHVNRPLRALIFDSWYDEHHGVISLVKVIDGTLEVGKQIVVASTRKAYKLHDVGIMYPERISTGKICAGQVGYLACNMRAMKESKVGDSIFYRGEDKNLEPLPGFMPPHPMVFAGIYPVDGEDFQNLQDAIEKLLLTDSSVEVQKETSLALGSGYRCGFLGVLHMNVFQQRLSQEFSADIIISAPTVSYKVRYTDETEKIIDSPKDFPDGTQLLKVEEIYEPMVNLSIICPKEHLGPVLVMCQERRGEQLDISALGNLRVSVQYKIPLSEIILDFYDRLKSVTRGYATMDYEDAGFEPSDIVLINIMVNQENVDALSFMVHKSIAYSRAKEIVSRLASIIKRQLFEVRIQASLGSRIICSEKIKAYRKDVTAKCYGGDVSRKRKLLEKQKEGKKRMKSVGSVSIPNSAFADVFRNV